MLNVPEFKAAMAKKEYTQKALAEILGISEKNIFRTHKKQAIWNRRNRKTYSSS